MNVRHSNCSKCQSTLADLSQESKAFFNMFVQMMTLTHFLLFFTMKLAQNSNGLKTISHHHHTPTVLYQCSRQQAAQRMQEIACRLTGLSNNLLCSLNIPYPSMESSQCRTSICCTITLIWSNKHKLLAAAYG